MAIVGQDARPEFVRKTASKVFAHLEMARMDMRTDIDVETRRLDVVPLTDALHSGFGDTRHHASPACMHDGEGATRRNHDDRHAIGEAEHGPHFVARHDHSIGSILHAQGNVGTIGAVLACNHHISVNLFRNDNRIFPHTESTEELLPVQPHAFGIVLNMIAQIERIVRRLAFASCALGKADAHAESRVQLIVGKNGA